MAANDSVALVTGAGRGIGRAVALALGASGYRLALVARTAPELEEVARELDVLGTETLVVSADLADVSNAAECVRRTVERFGRLDVVVNNAGLAESSGFASVDIEEIDRVLAVTLRATIAVTHAALPLLLERGEGAAVINIASRAGLDPVPGASVYTAAKHGVVGFTDALFEEHRHRGLKVSAICPGFVDSGSIEATDEQRARMIVPEDIAAAVLYVLESSARVCPSLLVLRPQRSPFRG